MREGIAEGGHGGHLRGARTTTDGMMGTCCAERMCGWLIQLVETQPRQF